jgi:hypothetical protein
MVDYVQNNIPNKILSNVDDGDRYDPLNVDKFQAFVMVRLKLHRHCLRERKRVSWVVHLYHKN